MSWDRHRTPRHGGSAPATPGFNAVAPEWMINYGAADAAPAVPAAESTLGSHPWVALSSAQVLPEWINLNLADNRSAANGDNPLNFVSHPRGSLQISLSIRLFPPASRDSSCSGGKWTARACRGPHCPGWRRFTQNRPHPHIARDMAESHNNRLRLIAVLCNRIRDAF